jgi:amino acid adenylation domain-containing protein
MSKQLLNTILSNIKQFNDQNAFFINEQFYTYSQFSNKIAGISEELKTNKIPLQTPVGVITTDSLETYASIISLWINGLIFVPISPSNSKERNENSIKQAGIKYILSSTNDDTAIIESKELSIIETQALSANSELKNINNNPNNILYLLFTSGSTGTPKGVPITQNNLESFINSFLEIDYQLNHEDKFLQIYDLSFDASVHCYTLPFFLGGCIYTIPAKEVKYLYAYKLMKEQELTFVKMPPSTITYLKPYFSKINLGNLKYTLFGGEALPSNLVKEWKKCAPNSEIHNVYGPTEATINCFYYNATNNIKDFNGTVCIGKAMGEITAIVIDENNTILDAHQKGELCVAGNQITNGYWKNETKNIEAFIQINNSIFYKTGDIVYFDEEQDYYYCGRIDSQVQIQGYRVELGEIEHHVRNLTKLNHIAVIDQLNKNGTNQLFLFLENYTGLIDELKEHLSQKIPNYMIPQKITNLDAFPLLTSGKIDRNKLKELI